MSLSQKKKSKQKNASAPMFLIENILDSRISESGMEQVLVSWVGYPNSESTWEPRTQVPSTLLKEYETSKREREKPRKPSSLSSSISMAHTNKLSAVSNNFHRINQRAATTRRTSLRTLSRRRKLDNSFNEKTDVCKDKAQNTQRRTSLPSLSSPSVNSKKLSVTNKKARKRTKTKHTTITPKNEIEYDENEEYEVEKILDHRFVDGRPQYLIKWVGWNLNDSTWEDEDCVQGCIIKVQEFWADQDKLSSPKSLRSSSATTPSSASRTERLNKRRRRSEAIFANTHYKSVEINDVGQNENGTFSESKSLPNINNPASFDDSEVPYSNHDTTIAQQNIGLRERVLSMLSCVKTAFQSESSKTF